MAQSRHFSMLANFQSLLLLVYLDRYVIDRLGGILLGFHFTSTLGKGFPRPSLIELIERAPTVVQSLCVTVNYLVNSCA